MFRGILGGGDFWSIQRFDSDVLVLRPHRFAGVQLQRDHAIADRPLSWVATPAASVLIVKNAGHTRFRRRGRVERLLIGVRRFGGEGAGEEKDASNSTCLE